jgi:hypothetical protein
MGQEELFSESQKPLGFFEKLAGLLDHPGAQAFPTFFPGHQGFEVNEQPSPLGRGHRPNSLASKIPLANLKSLVLFY